MSSYFNSGRSSYNTRTNNSSSYLDSFKKTFANIMPTGITPTGYQKNLIIAALIALVIVLLYLAYSIVYAEKHKAWPPMTPPCPDYWEMNNDSSGNNTCSNIKNLGKCQPANGQKHLVMNFNDPSYNGSNGLCAKYTWANNCGVSWDGITYGIDNPCVYT